MRKARALVLTMLALLAAACGSTRADTVVASGSVDREAQSSTFSNGPPTTRTSGLGSSTVTTTTPTTANPAPPVAQACPAPAAVAGRAGAKPVRVGLAERQYAGNGQRLDPPPSEPQPAVSEEEAVRRARQQTWPGFDPGPSPTIAIVSFSDDAGSVELGPDGTQTKLYQDRLVWALRFPHAVVGGPSGAPGVFRPGETTTTTAAPPCYLGNVFIPVDANTGEVFFIKTEGEEVR